MEEGLLLGIASIQANLYSKVSKASLEKLLGLWQVLGLPQEEQKQEIEQIAANAVCAWETAVEQAEQHKTTLQLRIREHFEEIAILRDQLCDDDDLRLETDILLHQDATCSGSGRTVKEQYDYLTRLLSQWQQKKLSRTHHYQALQTGISSLNQQMGLSSVSQSNVDMSLKNLNMLQEVRQNLLREKVTRLSRLENLIDRHRNQCIALGDDPEASIILVHPSLRHFRHIDVSTQTNILDGQEPETVLNIDLSDGMFLKFETKLKDMRALQEQRQTEVKALLLLLKDLQSALSHLPERKLLDECVQLLEGPQCLHAGIHEKCLSEVIKLETQQTSKIRELVLVKSKELQQLCATSHTPPPEISDLVSKVAAKTSKEELHACKVLSCLMQMLSETEALSAKRAPIVLLIRDLETAYAESNWLAGYENNPERFKGRDARHNVQRSLKASKMREGIPALAEKLDGMMKDWRVTEDSVFHYDDQDYEARLNSISRQVESLTVAKQRKHQEKVREKTGGSQTPHQPVPQSPSKPISKNMVRVSLSHLADMKMASPLGQSRANGLMPPVSARVAGRYSSVQPKSSIAIHTPNNGSKSQVIVEQASDRVDDRTSVADGKVIVRSASLRSPSGDLNSKASLPEASLSLASMAGALATAQQMSPSTPQPTTPTAGKELQVQSFVSPLRTHVPKMVKTFEEQCREQQSKSPLPGDGPGSAKKDKLANTQLSGARHQSRIPRLAF